MKKSLLVIFLGMLAVGVIWYSLGKKEKDDVEEPQQNETENSPAVVAENLYVPWSIIFLPDGRMLAAERNGNLKFFEKDAKEPSATVKVPGVSETGEGGLLGMAHHPDFASNKLIYLYFTFKDEGLTLNKVVRYALDKAELREDKIIIDRIPGGPRHNGGRIAFGPDGYLYITTGDAGQSENAQDVKSLAGKILRLDPDGVIPDTNPFESEVYSYGHRNPQGLVWDDEGRMWSIEHGRSGVQSGFDEINLIERGGNYGWPLIQGDSVRNDMRKPVKHSGATATWAPANLVYQPARPGGGSGKLYFTGLRGQSLYEVPVLADGKLGPLSSYFKGGFGRLRALSLSPSGEIYFATSNKDGRGRPSQGDDKIFKVKF